MSQQNPISVVGVYRIPVTPTMFDELVEKDYRSNGQEIVDSQRQYFLKLAAAVVLIDLRVETATPIRAGKMFQHEPTQTMDYQQVGYDAVFLDITGTKILPHFDQPKPPYRLCFWLHYFVAGRPLETPFGQLRLPTPTPVPSDLFALVPYTPPD